MQGQWGTWAKALGVVSDLSPFLSQASWGPNPCCGCIALLGRPELPFLMEGVLSLAGTGFIFLVMRELAVRPSVRAALQLLL